MIKARRRWVGASACALLWLLLAWGAWLMIDASVSYLELGAEHPFILEKLPLRFEGLFKLTLYTHVASALLALPCCLLLVLKITQKKVPRLHRWLGRTTGGLILLFVVPSGFGLSLAAKGGWISTLGFMLTGAITFYAMTQAIRTARRRQLRDHRRYSLHVLAQLSVAVVSRLLLVVAEGFALDEHLAYLAGLWAPVVLAAIGVEIFTRRRRRPIKARGDAHETDDFRAGIGVGYQPGLGRRAATP